jgi:hypothetical protein
MCLSSRHLEVSMLVLSVYCPDPFLILLLPFSVTEGRALLELALAFLPHSLRGAFHSICPSCASSSCQTLLRGFQLPLGGAGPRSQVACHFLLPQPKGSCGFLLLLIPGLLAASVCSSFTTHGTTSLQ